jgi:4-hydroxybenzoate polyprenyltransferase
VQKFTRLFISDNYFFFSSFFFFAQAQQIINESRDDWDKITLSSSWGNNYLQNSKIYKAVNGHFLDIDRLTACTVHNLKPFYDMVQEHFFDKNGKLLFELCDIWNLDETNDQMKPNGQVAEFIGTEETTRREPERTVNTTITFCVNAKGKALKVQVIHKGVRKPAQYELFDDDWVIVYVTKSGWQEKMSFDQFMRNYVLPQIAKKRKGSWSVLFLDGHPSRINPRLWLHSLSLKIHIVFLPAHSSTKTQVLDCGVNAVFKKALRAAWATLVEEEGRAKKERQEQGLPEPDISIAAAHRNSLFFLTLLFFLN